MSWSDAAAFCTKLTEWEQKAGRLPAGYEYRLPTEAEWEYAARGGAGSKGYAYAGSNSVDEVAWYSGNSGTRTHPVGLKQPNELGLHDMSGNVWEWCLDWDEKHYSRLPNTFPANTPAGSFRVIRGGGRFIVANSWRVAYRPYYGPSYSRSNLGFRVAVAAPVRVF